MTSDDPLHTQKVKLYFVSLSHKRRHTHTAAHTAATLSGVLGPFCASPFDVRAPPCAPPPLDGRISRRHYERGRREGRSEQGGSGGEGRETVREGARGALHTRPTLTRSPSRKPSRSQQQEKRGTAKGGRLHLAAAGTAEKTIIASQAGRHAGRHKRHSSAATAVTTTAATHACTHMQPGHPGAQAVHACMLLAAPPDACVCCACSLPTAAASMHTHTHTRPTAATQCHTETLLLLAAAPHKSSGRRKHSCVTRDTHSSHRHRHTETHTRATHCTLASWHSRHSIITL